MEYLKFLFNPKKFLSSFGIKTPANCRIETTIENHDWLGDYTSNLKASNGSIICNVGGGNIARTVTGSSVTLMIMMQLENIRRPYYMRSQKKNN